MEGQKLLAQRGDNVPSSGRQGRSLAALQRFGKRGDVVQPFGNNAAELTDQSPDHVRKLGALTDHKLARAMLAEERLLVWRLYRDKAHCRAGHRLADRRSIGSVGLSTFHIGLDVDRRHQPNVMAKFREFTSPVVARAARFHTDEAGRKLL